MESLLFSPVKAVRAISRCSLTRSQCIRQRSARCQSIHTSGTKSATPYPIAEVHSPPPPPPEPSPSTIEDRLLRKKRQAELLQRGREAKANPAKPVTALQKRFWKHVSVKETSEGLQVYLDTRPVRTADKNVLTIPKNKHQLATAIALEWDLLVTSHQALKHHYIPLTSLISRAIDIETAVLQGDARVRDSIVTMLMKYLDSDTLLCWAPKTNIHDPSQKDETTSLRGLQMRVATPIISHLTSQVWPGVEINPVLDSDSILPTPQPAMTQEIIRGWITGLKAFELAGLERAVLATKSLLVGVRLLVEWSEEFASLSSAKPVERFGIEDAAHACSLEVTWQTSMWGEVDDTHDVDKEDVRRQLGGVVLLICGAS
jgi:ATP synthase F1 complex assembly factor 2